MKKLIMMILVAGCFALGAYADVSYSFNGGMMTITAPSTLAGKGIRIVWDTEDRGTEPAAWANVANVVDAVPAAGGTYYRPRIFEHSERSALPHCHIHTLSSAR